MLEIDLGAEDALAIRNVAQSLSKKYPTTDSEDLLSDLARLTRGLPQQVIDEVSEYMGRTDSELILVRNHLISDDELGDTPTSWKAPDSAAGNSLEYEILVMLYGSILGLVFGWATQQSGHIVNDIIPIESHADQQVGASSKVELAWHTEDAFHPGRADFICLLCLRNPTQAPTTVATLGDIEANGGLPAELFEPCVFIAADDAQLAGANELGTDGWTGSALKPVPILRKTESGMQMCVDPAYMSVPGDDQGVHEAVAGFCQSVEEHVLDVVMQPGDLLILDNRRVVHGRRPFKPTYSGRDRWLKRINVAMDFSTRSAYCSDPGLRLLL